ncbi:uncharacterized protein LOC123212940 [Mangifera indica]|uniref:uncharacterized protein LOC123212940 n=1 Tax=Mangifera indica TaxID=29780 RepID=UPI001CFB772F|nr:uncharacterized protein LOC123212940 [Mangifera indica]XP_044488127.1 uncharacterized protein LOC123212940 [Mangifera indica]
MVLGLRTKNRKRISLQVDYLFRVQEIRPWPPSQSLRSVHSVLLQWKNDDQSSGSLISGVGDGKVEFSESFRLQVTLCQEASKKGTARDIFQKNCLEFYLYENGKDKSQLLGSAVINLADYGIMKEAIAISTPFNFKKTFSNTAQPVLSLMIEPFYKDSSSSSPKSSLVKEVSMLGKNGTGSFSDLMNEGNHEECEIASFTDDDDISSHSSLTIPSSTFGTTSGSTARNYKNGSDSAEDSPVNGEPALSSSIASAKQEVNPVVEVLQKINGSTESSSSASLFSDSGNVVNDPAAKVASSNMSIEAHVNMGQIRVENSPTDLEGGTKSQRHENNGLEAATSELYVHLLKKKDKRCQENGQGNQILKVKKNSLEDRLVSKLPEDAAKNDVKLRSNSIANSRFSLGAQSGTVSNDKLKNIKSVQLRYDSAVGYGQINDSQYKWKEINNAKDKYDDCKSNAQSTMGETANGFSNIKVELESKIKMLEEELREAAALEIGLYSVIAEHGCSINKVHVPARRLSRFYLYACKARSQSKRASAARAAFSGLVLVSKACGNDVPRLTFWLSNSVVLRAIVSEAIKKLQLSDGLCTKNNSDRTAPNKEEKDCSIEDSDDWEDPQTFVIALEKFEAWIFSRIIESVWWQTFTPHMQSAAAKGSGSRKTSRKRYGLGDQEQGNLSIELWKKAFKDACELLCPIRAGGHDCGCLPVLAKLVMEQLVDRLDVAMFNAILRESAEEMPTDPVSDPISDPKVLPIPAGKSSFGAGAQLKNAIGSWSRWLTDLFGIDDNDPPENMNEISNDMSMDSDTSSKAFHLLNALSDLMMLPSEMLVDSSTRKEVCPTFGVEMIKRVLDNFVPDDFNPTPIPRAVFDALDSEDLGEAEEDSVTIFPCSAAPTIYSPPPAVSLIGIIGEFRSPDLQSGSTVLKKSYTSDDELDELDSPVTSIIIDNSHTSTTSAPPNWMPKGNGGRKVVRYQLLQEVWKEGK